MLAQPDSLEDFANQSSAPVLRKNYRRDLKRVTLLPI
jgi:hypothetical protein